ncbi:FkbM family methyltransferase [Salinarchaeum sp. IM2453]|uniref:FkbM family methyltransferase n=1 Tax=Salinarchaeum sp. IM2453 TaxID=2862870 RepID=UPI001C83AF95|nr:FkbM family methyltransferase [Salinarchaeum sp. IM2453]QZA88362.1 FkbM family methyltransferase [Salinarchaeum sp. IM2453]
MSGSVRQMFDQLLADQKSLPFVSQYQGSVVELGYQAYQQILSMNYARRIFPRTIKTPAGNIKSYEIAGAHRNDILLQLLASQAGTDDVIYDIGAYAGEYALALTAEFPDRHVVAFDPSMQNMRRHVVNRNETCPKGTVELHLCGLGNQSGYQTFYQSSHPKQSSFSKKDATRWGANVTNTQDVPIKTIDSLTDIPPPDHIKIDAEGTELSILDGAVDTINTHRPALYIEPHDLPDESRKSEIFQWCKKHSYNAHSQDDVLMCVPESQ